MIGILERASDGLLSRFLPEISAAGCCPPDPWEECDWFSDSACASSGCYVWFRCSQNCGCHTFCHQIGCCC